MRNIWTVFKRELAGYFNNPLAYVFLIIFSLLSMGLTFVLSEFLDRNDASLISFFMYHPWIYMILGPAIGMRLWAEEHRMGTTELLLTMPISAWHAIVGKFLAACVVLAAALVCTTPIVITIYRLGTPDGLMVFSGYLGSFMIGMAMIAITCAVSAVTRSQIACLLISVVICFFLVLSGYPAVTDFLRDQIRVLAEVGNSISFWWHQNETARGNMRLQTPVYLLSVTGFCLYLTSVVIRSKRS